MDNQNFTILLVGSGAREHAIAKSISKSKRPFKLIVFGSSMNPGIAALADTYISGNINDPEAVADYAKSNHASLAVVGPEAPLEAGVADKLWSLGIPVVGPKMQLAMLETSKQFTRNLMADYDVPGCPKFKYFSDLDGAGDFLGTLMDNYVVKADGLWAVRA